MTAFVTGVTLALAVLALVPLVRIVRGPTTFDRVLGLGLIGTKAILLLVLIGVVYDRLDMFVDLALAYAILNFIGVLAIAKFLERRGEEP
ncbi:MAG: monovalent cation/H+ antiporter complex subunit F [Dehalococcoidia bacterium]|nr:monovalent cation/H+ antiporter complex subunit F [Dehalococcoidia bacterium]MDW8119789.1 monovalent cation/H+ antiporter complex subunit F [Chloroflexota bacterium]